MGALARKVIMEIPVNLPKDLVQRAKIRAIKDGITLTRMIEDLLGEYLKRPGRNNAR